MLLILLLIIEFDLMRFPETWPGAALLAPGAAAMQTTGFSISLARQQEAVGLDTRTLLFPEEV